MKAKLLLTLIICSTLSACSDANMAGMSAWGKKHHIKLYSGGKVVEEWVSSGKIENEANSDGYYFKDDKTGKMVSVTGDVVIEVE